MFTKPMTAIAVVLALGATPMAAQDGTGGTGGDADGSAGAEAGAAAEAGGAEAGTAGEADAEAGTADADGAAETDTADSGATAEAEADADADADVDAAADADAASAPEADAGATADVDATPEGEPSEAAAAPEIGAGAETKVAVEPDEAENVARVEIGTLTCDLEAVTNALIYAQESFDCTFVDDAGRTIAYDGNIEKLGANLQLKTDQTLKWVVLSSVSMDEPQDLSGTYFGASAQASLGVGAGANVLVGGSGDNFTLQPVSVTGQEGLGASLTLDSLTLSRTGF